MELELKHLAPYLPYNLKCQVTDKRKRKIATLGGLYNDGNCVFHDTIESEKGFKRIKPILLPMSSLYTEMEDGTVHICELAKIATSDIKSLHNMSWIVEGGKDKYAAGRIEYDEITFDYDGVGAFWINRQDVYDHSYSDIDIHSQIDLFTYLFEHHFDVFGLIDKGLALDKTKIK